jgi:hypothetical protein
VAKIEQFGKSKFCHNVAMTTKTIPAYLEDERKKDKDAQQRIQEEAARIQPLHHGHHRAAKQPKLESSSVVRPAHKSGKTASPAGKNAHTARKKVTTARKAA